MGASFEVSVKLTFTRVNQALPDHDRYVWVVVETPSGLQLVVDEAAVYNHDARQWGWAYSGIVSEKNAIVAWSYLPTSMSEEQLRLLCNA